jgi:hypothetical protein
MANDFIFFILLLRPEWPLGKKTRGRGDLFRVIHLSFSAGASEHNEIIWGPSNYLTGRVKASRHEVRTDLRRAISANQGVLEIVRPCWRKKPLAKDICGVVEPVHTAVRSEGGGAVASERRKRHTLTDELSTALMRSGTRTRPVTSWPNAHPHPPTAASPSSSSLGRRSPRPASR